MKIKEISKENRPREKMIKNGASSLSNEELLAILLRNGDKNNSAIDLAYLILNKSSNIKELIELNYYDLVSIKGIGPSKACLIIAAFELSKRAYSYMDKNVSYDDASKVFDLLNPIIGHKKSEFLYALYLDNRCRLIKLLEESSGATNKCIFPLQKILYNAIKFQASAVIIVHNHPSGDLNPSSSDLSSTEALQELLDTIGINLIDHIIIGNNSYYSFNSEHML